MIHRDGASGSKFRSEMMAEQGKVSLWLGSYNSILLIYSFDYSKGSVSNNKMDFIGSVDMN